MLSNPDILKELLLEDYRYRAEAMKNSETIGETRLNIFVGLATLLLGAVVSLSTEEFGPKGDALKLIVLAVFLTLLVFGFLTLLRILIRNERTDECKRDLDHIRQSFKQLFDENESLTGYYPVGYYHLSRQSSSNSCLASHLPLRRFGGLAHMMSAINSLLVAGFVACLILSFESGFSLKAPRTVIALFCALIAFMITLTQLMAYIKRREAKVKIFS